ncbi:MAG: hypothetical protein J2P17_06090 [Mycobacterium sp.]|nr:hypothetical protein [Mycobacterium sp.]
MGEVFTAMPVAMGALSATHHAVGATHITAGSADHGAHAAAAAAALGPIGAHYLAHYLPAQANCLNATLQVGNVFHALGSGTGACTAATVAFDNA